MNRQFEVRQITGTFVIVAAIATVTLVIVAQGASLPTAIGEPVVDAGNIGGQAGASVIEAVDQATGAAFARGRAWKSVEIGAEQAAAQDHAEVMGGTESGDALSLRSYLEADRSAGDAVQVPLPRSWKADEIGTGEAASERASPIAAGDVMSLRRHFSSLEDAGSNRTFAPIERGWKADEIGGASEVNAGTQPQISLDEDALSLGYAWIGSGEEAKGFLSPSSRAMQDKLERFLAVEAQTAGASSTGESCGPTSPFGPQPC